VKIRLALPSEAAVLARVINSAFVVEQFFVDGDRVTVAQVEEYLRKGQFLAVDDEGVMAGCVYLEPRGERAYLGLLSVDPSRQGGGLGSRLMAAAENHARGAGCRAVDLNVVNVREELPAFYARCGYLQTGTAPFPADTPTKIPCHFVCMSKTLA
jgi:GNAT superfamily N-acetyltransferase